MRTTRQSLDFSQNIFCPRYTPEQDAKLVQMCLDEPRLFMEAYCYINAKEEGLIKFKMRSDQEIVYNLFQSLRHRNRRVRLICLKGRQIGVSSLIQLIIFTLCRLRRYTDALLIAHKDSTSKKVGEMFRIAYDNLPDEIRPAKETRTDEKLKFAGINSSIVTTTAKTEDPARGLSLHCLQATEASFWPNFMHTLGPILNCLAKDAKSSFAGVETTARDMEGDFFQLWDSVVRGRSTDIMEDDDLQDWTPVFLPWWIHPLYEAGKLDLPPLTNHDMKTLAWEHLSDAERELVEMNKQEWTKAFPYIRTYLRDMNFEQWQKKIKWRRWCLHNECQDSEIKFLSEMGESPETCFQAQGQSILDKKAIIWYTRHTKKDGIVGRMEKDANGNPIFVSRDEHVMQCTMENRVPDPDVLFPLTVWEFPRRDEKYGAGVDCAMGSADALERERGDLALEGDTDSDFSTMEVFSEHRIQCAELRSRVLPPYDFAEMVALVGMFWNQTKIMVEAGYAGGNTAGFAVLQRLKDIYRNLARWERVDHAGKKLTDYVGWTPNPAAQEAFMGELQRAINHGAGMLTPGTEGNFDIDYPRLKIHSAALLNELMHYQLKKSGRVGAASGQHDDLCVAEGTMIRTQRGMVPIEQVVVGDSVLTHLGRYRAVTATSARRVDSIYRIKPAGFMPLKITVNHPMLMHKRYTDCRDGNRLKHRSPEWRSLEDGDHAKYAVGSPVCRDVEDVTAIDLLPYCPPSYVDVDGTLTSMTYGGRNYKKRVNPKVNPIKRMWPVDEDFLMLMGYFYAEGSTGVHSFALASHKNDVGEHAWLCAYLKRMGLHPCSRSTTGNGWSITAGCVPLRNWLRANFGVSSEKHFPQWVERLPPEKQRLIIAGYWMGDGDFSHTSLRCTSISRTGIRQLYEMLLRNGITPTLTALKLASPRLMRDRLITSKPLYGIRIAGKQETEVRGWVPPDILKDKTQGVPSQRRLDRIPQTKMKWSSDYVVGQLQEVEEEEYDGMVYNLAVEEDESYLANDLAVHNCRAFGLALLTLKQMGRPRSLSTQDLHALPSEAVSYDTYGHRDWSNQGDDGFPSWLFA